MENQEPCQTSKMELFAKIVNGLKLLTIFAKHFILYVGQDSEYPYGSHKLHERIAQFCVNPVLCSKYFCPGI